MHIRRSLGWTLACASLIATACSESHMTEPDAAIVIELDGAMLDGGPPDTGPVEDHLGEACSADEACGTDGVCLNEPDFLPGGYCSRACSSDEDCGPGGACLMVGMGQQLCFRSCEPGASPRQCRPGYGCGSFGFGAPPVCLGGCSDDTDCPSGLMCEPDSVIAVAGSCFDPGAGVGDACASADECPASGFCLDEDGNGWPEGSCVGISGCDPDANTGCDGDAQCIPTGDTPLCVDGCTTAADCRPGYECSGLMAFPTRLVCNPACTSDDQCSAGNVCNAALGTCDVPFDPDALGGECSRFRGGCEGGSCLAERELGFPRGYCAYTGCTVGDDTTCPTGGACSPTAAGGGVCFDACATDSDCRGGYACRNVVPSDATSSLACLPACDADADCASMMRRCNVGTGLCTTPFVDANQGEPCVDGGDCPGGRCLTEADGFPDGTCAAVGCSLMSGTTGVDCPSGSTCVDDEGGRPEIGYCLDACTVGAATGCRTDYTCVELTAGATEGVCRPTAAPLP